MLTTKKIDNELIEAREAKFVLRYGQSAKEDWTLVKEKVYLKDGSTVKRLISIEDFKRPIFITKPQYQNYQEKRELEEIDRCDKYMVSRRDQTFTVARALGMAHFRGNPMDLYKSPYVYGTDFDHCTYLKYMYSKKWDKFSPYDVAVLDIETNMFSEEQETIIITVSFKDKMITCVVKDFVQGYPNPKDKLKKLYDQYLKDMLVGHPPKEGEKDTRKRVGDRNINWEVVLVDNAGEAIVECFKRVHEWSPDLIAIWNIDFDLPKMIADLERHGYDPKDVFSDPAIAPHLRHFTYKEGPAFKDKKGKPMPLKPAQRWHWVDVPASFYFVDAMQVYYIVRIAQQDENSYALDVILQKELSSRKLKFKEADHVDGGGGAWHVFMQKNFPLEYVIYCCFDCISVEMLDEVTTDLQIAMPQGCGISQLSIFNSQPRRLWDAVSAFLLERGECGGNSRGLKRDVDDLLISTDDWINTLPAHLLYLKTLGQLGTNSIYGKPRAHCADADVSGAYPSNQIALNISRSTTSRELLAIQNVDELYRRRHGINFSGGITNSVGFMTSLFGVPTMSELKEIYEKENKK